MRRTYYWKHPTDESRYYRTTVPRWAAELGHAHGGEVGVVVDPGEGAALIVQAVPLRHSIPATANKLSRVAFHITRDLHRGPYRSPDCPGERPMRYHTFSVYGIGRRSKHKRPDLAIRAAARRDIYGWVVIDDDGQRWIDDDGPRKHGSNYCPACGRRNAYADYVGHTDGPRYYHADCWARLSDREQAAAWKHAEELAK